MVLEVFTRAIKQQTDINGIQIGKEVKFSFFADDMIVYITETKNSTKKFLQPKNTFSNVAEYKINPKEISSPPLHK